MNDEVLAPTYQLAERFFDLQGEGTFAGTPMAFLRFTGCSVGKKVCHACDTDFDKSYPWLGGGVYTASELVSWAYSHHAKHVCLTGGEPLDQDLTSIANSFQYFYNSIHIETSGTKPLPACFKGLNPHIVCSPKPGFLPEVVESYEVKEIKVIVGGLGNGGGWPTLEDAKRWAHLGKPVFLQPRNTRFVVDPHSLALAKQLVLDNPELRLSVQLHKLLNHR